MVKNYTKEFCTYLDFGKDIILDVLSKFECFNEYYKYIMEKDNNVQNLIIKKDNLTYLEKANILSSILTIIINSPSFLTNKNIEFFELTSNNKNVYLDARNFLLKIIDNLKSDSILNNGYLKTLSRIKEDINKINENLYENKRNTFMIELMNLDDLKNNLKKYVPNMVVRYFNSKSKSAAEYDIFSGNILINELIFTEKKNDFLILNNNEASKNLEPFIKGKIELNNEKNKKIYDLFVFRAFWRLNHEGCGHKPVSKINRGKANTPKKVIINKGYTEGNDAGEIIEYYVYHEVKQNYFDYLKYAVFNPITLLNENLYINDSFLPFWDIFLKLEIDKNDEKKEELDDKLSFYNKISNLFLSDKSEKFVNQYSNKFNATKISPHPRSKI